MVRRLRSKARAEEMRRLFAEMDESGLSVRAFARERGMNESLLWYWRKRLAELDGTDSERERSKPALLPVHIVDRDSSPGFALELRGGRRIHVPRGFDGAELRRLVEVLEAC